MTEYIVTCTYYVGADSDTLAVTVKANSRNDAFIIGASKFYAMFAGTETEIFGIGVTIPTP